MVGNAGTQRMPGRNHEVEPEGEPALLAGALWELDCYGENEAKPAMDRDLFDPLEEAGMPGIHEIKRRWQRLGQPDPWNAWGSLIDYATEAARLAGFDVYSSDTRTWVYASAIDCNTCGGDKEACWTPVVSSVDGLLATGLLDELRFAFPGLHDKLVPVDSNQLATWLSKRLRAEGGG